MSDIFGFMKGNEGDSNPESQNDDTNKGTPTEFPNAEEQSAGEQESQNRPNEYLEYVEKYEEASGKVEALSDQVEKCDRTRSECLQKEQQLEERIKADAENTKQIYIDSITKIETQLNKDVEQNNKELGDNYAQEKELRDEQNYYQNSAYTEQVFNDEIRGKINQLYQQGKMTDQQKEYMNQDPAKVCGSTIRTGGDLRKQEESFSKTEFCKKLMDPKLASSAEASTTYSSRCFTFMIIYFVAYIVGSLIGESVLLFGRMFFSLGLCMAGAGIAYLIVRTVIFDYAGYVITCTAGAALVFIITLVTGYPAKWWLCSESTSFSGIIFRLVLLLITAAIGEVGMYEMLNCWGERHHFQNYSTILQEADGDEDAERGMYYYLNHAAILSYLNGPVKRGNLNNVNQRLQQLMNQRNELLKEKSSLDQREVELSEMKKQANDQTHQINETLRADLSNSAENTKNKELRDARQQYEWANAELKIASQNLKGNQEEVKKYKDILIHWDQTPVLDDNDPAFQKEIVVRQGVNGDDSLFMLHHDLEWVNIEYQAGLRENAGEVLENLIWWLAEAFRVINAPELLQIHVVDEKNGGKALQGDDRFLGKIGTFKNGQPDGHECYVYGKDVRALKSYLDAQWNKIYQTREEHAEQIDQSDKAGHPEDYLIYSANKILRSTTSVLQKGSVYAYKVLFILVPNETDEHLGMGDIRELLGTLDQSSQSGIIPFFFSNRDNVNKNYQPYIDNCKKHYSADLSVNRLTKE